jgi:hypothetical protein
MLLSRSTSVVLLAFVTPLFLHMPFSPFVQENVERSTEKGSAQDMPPANCHVTLPSDGAYEPPFPESGPPGPHRFYFGTEKLWTVLPTDGTWRGPYSGAARDDFVYSDKLTWLRNPAVLKVGTLTIDGRRLDGPAPSFIETNEFFGYNRGGIVGGIAIPAYGCWEITGRYDDQKLTFTVWVTSFATEGPSSGAALPETLPEQPAQKAALPRVYLGSETTASALVYRVLPEIPPAAQALNTYGTVVLHAVIGTDGRAHDLSYVSGPQVLVQAAMDAVRWYQYRQPIDDSMLPIDPLYPYVLEIKEEVDTTIAVPFPPPRN